MSIAPVRIPQLQQANPIVDKEGRMTNEFARRLNDIFASLAAAVNGVIEAQNAATVAKAAADAAQAAADAAQAAADSAGQESGLASSGIMPRTVVSGSSVGSVDVGAHTRYYANGATVSVAAGTVPDSYAVGDVVYVSYLDPSRAGGAVLYEGSLTFRAQTGDRHVVGSVTMPATGVVTGQPGPPPPGAA